MKRLFPTLHFFMAVGIGFLIANLLIGMRIHGSLAAADGRDDEYRYMNLFSQVLYHVRNQYVDREKVAWEDLYFSALSGMLSSLDPHSQFLDPKSFEGMQQETSGAFGGLGIQIGLRDGILTVIAPMEDTPAFEAGILPGDRIIEINGESTQEMSLDGAVELLRGEPDTDVSITILRMGDERREIKKLTLTRAIISVTSVKYDKELHPGNIGYIRISQFNSPTEQEFQDALNDLVDKGMEALVLDLRNNPGGLLSSAVNISSKFLPPGELVVFTRGRGAREQRFTSSTGEKQPPYPMAILVNSYSASGSEIVAGALQDHRRAVLIGERTFGKGSVQSVLPVRGDSGAAIRLTTAKYYTPSERVIHGVGIEPDILIPITDDMDRILYIQRTRPENGFGLPDWEPVEDVQLERAFDMLRGIKHFTDHKNQEYAWH
ncbi:MAG: S41 family peptidase [Verrucomicrobiota bacterium]|jgi:carboxyl-terminal processing protease|nr:S41 family peptidase [Verrucomicrobiota bacterium]MDD8050258.1 S41 family peptidase [Verrucomicrobiota bacterium]MDI9384628.1 S41 family peptidase [Verrucomicrobiota bacterium]